MAQLNFRLTKYEKQLVDAIAAEKGLSASELARQSLLKEIGPIRVDLAFRLLVEGRIGRKKTWIISGLFHHEFLVEWTKRGVEELIPDAFIEKEIEIARTIDLDKYLRNPST